MTMDCERFTDGKLLLAEGEGGHDAELARHLAACDACRADVDEMREVASVYREEAVEPIPEPLRRRILAMRPEARRPALWQRLMPAVAAALLLAALIIPFLRPAAPPPVEPVDTDWSVPAMEPVPDIAPVNAPPRPASIIDAQLRDLRRRTPKLNDTEW